MLPAVFARADSVADEAEVNFQLGAERYRQGDYRAALSHFLASNRLAPNDNVRFNIARTFQRLRQYPEAYRWCELALSGAIDAQLRAQLEETRAAIKREVSVIDLVTVPSGATVYLDRKDLGSIADAPARIAVAPGKHRLIAEVDGYEPALSEELDVAPGEVRNVTLALTQIVGKVVVRAAAATKVWAEGRSEIPSCVTPCTLTLPVGEHRLLLERAGFRVRPIDVRVEAKQVLTVDAEAVPVTGSVLVTAVERDALIEIDGASVGFSPTVVRNVHVGSRRVRVSAPGFEAVEHEVMVEEGQQAELRDLVLPPLRKVTAAARVTQAIEDAPASVSLISEQELAAFRYPTIYEALRGQRGVTLSNDGAYSAVSIRGLGQPGDYGNRILVLSDGATLNDNILWQSYVGYDGRVDLGDVGGIEVVRGPGSVLYGTGAVSGVVNLIPRGKVERPSLEGQVGAQDARTARGRVAGAIPVGRDGSLRLSASGARGGGDDVLLPGQPTLVRSLRKYDAATSNLRFTYGALTVQGFVTTRKQWVPNGAYGAQLGARPNDLRDTRSLGEVRYEPSLSKRVKLYTRAYGNVYHFSSQQTYAASDAPAPDTFVVSERYQGHWFGGEVRLMLDVVDGLQLSVGAESSASIRARLRGSSREDGTKSAYLAEDAPYRLHAGYALLNWRASPWLTVSLGGRVDSWSTFGATLNPRLALLLRPTRRDTFKLMGGRAFRAPSVYELRYNDGGVTQVSSRYDGYKLGPELVWSSELEYTRAFADGWSALLAGHFQYAESLIEQVQLSSLRASGAAEQSVVRYQNRGNSVLIAGGDLEVRREFAAGWMFAANYTYLFAGATRAQGGMARVPNVPMHAASVRGVVPLGARLRVAMRTTFEGPRKRLDLGHLETKMVVITDLVLSGELARPNLDYALGLYNLFDWRYALPTDPTFLTPTMPQPGRTLLASVTFRL